MNQLNNFQKGFTLVELVLAMTFISVMLLAIAVTIMQVAGIYTRGETLRNINQASRVVVADMRKVFLDADPTSIDTSQLHKGRLCTGEYTYVWSGEGENYRFNKYAKADGSEGDAVYFSRVPDKGGDYCRQPSAGEASGTTNANSLIEQEGVVELLHVDGDRSLRVYGFEVGKSEPLEVSEQFIYSVNIRLGTENKDVIDTTSQCLPPADSSSDINYCAVNHISFALKSGVR